MSTLTPTEEHLAAHQQQGRIEGILEQVVARLNSMESNHRQDMATMEANHRQDMATMEANHRQDMAALNGRLDRLTRWLIGIQLTTLIALGTLILTRLS